MAYQNDFGVSLKFYNAQGVEKHSHSDIELAYVLEGSTGIGVHRDVYTLKKDDMIVINSGSEHWWQPGKAAFVCVIRINKEILAKETGREYLTFWCNSVADKDTDYKEIRDIIGKMMAEYAIDMEKLSFRKKALFYQLFDVLLNKYMIESKTKIDALSDDTLFNKVLKFIRENYWRQLSLGEAAAQVYMTNSTFSRYFKKNAGINFLEYLNNLRLQNAMEDLLYSDKPLTRIALDHGFTNPSMFSKAFKAAYDMPPSEYKRMKKEASEPDVYKDEENVIYKEDLKKFVASQKQQAPEEVFKKQISVDVRNYRPYKKIWNAAVNIGSASELLSAKMQQHVLMLRDALGFKYVRLANIFSWDMRLRKDRSSRSLNFELIDNVLDFIATHKMYPFIELGDKPKRVFENLTKVIYMEDEKPIFQSMDESQWMLERFMEHIVLRYGVEEVEQWIFENWYDRRLERQNGGYDYFLAFDMVCETIKAKAPLARVGGCGMELGADYSEVFEHWRRQKHRPDFISVCAFPYKRVLPGFDVKENGAIRSTELHFLRNETRKLRQSARDYGMGNIPIMFTEWNLSMSDRNYYNDSCGKAAQMLMNMTEMLEDVDMGAYFYGSDLNVRYFDTTRLLFGGAGLISKDGLPKPVYYAFHFMKKMSSYILRAGDGYMITTDGKGCYDVLLYNYKNFNYSYFTKNEEKTTPDELQNIFTDDDAMEIAIELNNVVSGSYFIKAYNVGIHTSSILNEWQLLGENLELDMSDLDYLKRICIPHVKIRQENARRGDLVFTETLKAHDIRYIHIYK